MNSTSATSYPATLFEQRAHHASEDGEAEVRHW